jgi:hypothetical protein
MFESLMVPLGASVDTYDTRDVSFIDTCLAKLSLKETGAYSAKRHHHRRHHYGAFVPPRGDLQAAEWFLGNGFARYWKYCPLPVEFEISSEMYTRLFIHENESVVVF